MKTCPIILLVLLAFSCENEHFTRLKGKTMGTYYDIQYKSSQDYSIQIDSIFTGFIAAASTYDSTSEISEFNKNGKLRFRSAYLPRLLKKANYLHAETNGAFEPTLMPLIRAHGFSTQKRKSLGRHSIDSILSFVSLSYIKFDSTEMTALKPGVELDLSAIGEGFAIDLLARFLEEKKISHYKVEIGGEMRCRGLNPKNETWLVGIENPSALDSRELFKTIRLKNEAISTSGTSRKFYLDENGVKRSHIIDPKTGISVNNNLLSVTVKHNEATLADGLATSLMVMGLDSAKCFAIAHEFKVFITYEENGEVLSWQSPQFLNTQDRSISLR